MLVYYASTGTSQSPTDLEDDHDVTTALAALLSMWRVRYAVIYFGFSVCVLKLFILNAFVAEN